jgi:hypothetical protein
VVPATGSLTENVSCWCESTGTVSGEIVKLGAVAGAAAATVGDDPSNAAREIRTALAPAQSDI